MKRRFVDTPSDERCRWTITLRDGSEAQCVRRKAIGDLCAQHSKIDVRWSCAYCGGNDEYPRAHTMDCSRPQAGDTADNNNEMKA